MPWSGSSRCSMAASTNPARPSQTGRTIAAACALVELGVDRVEEHAPHVVLVLVPGAVADPHRTRSPVAGQVVEGPLGQVPLTADAVHDLELEASFGSPPVTASSTKPKYSSASQAKPSRYRERSMNAESLIQV